MTIKRPRAASSAATFSEAALTKLQESGLDIADAVALGITELDPFTVKALHRSFDPSPALYYPYYDAAGEPLASDLPDASPFYRLGYLRASAFGEKRPRYSQAPSTGVKAYFARTVTWPPVLSDAREPLLITEGERKAAKACKEGFFTLGLGGVDSFSQKQRGVALLPELEQIIWAKRRVYIIFDSDSQQNRNVRRAVLRLAKTLGQRGAETYEVQLPDVYDDGRKTGLDDFLVAKGADALTALLVAIHEEGAQPLAQNASLFELNEEVVYINDPGFFVHQRTHARWKKDAFLLTYAALPRCRIAADTERGWQEVPATRAWLEWPLRKQAGRLVYEPQRVGVPYERLQEAADGDPMRSTWNVWPGWGVVPRAGDVEPFLTLVDHIFKDVAEELKVWFLRWLAFPLQNPGTKLYSACVFYGRGQGTGKTLLGVTMGKLYGENYQLIRNDQLSGSFNGWAAGKQFILGDEIAGGDSHDKKLAERLKSMITQQTIMINQKNVPEYNLRDCINYLFTSNYGDAFRLDEEDRRFFVHRMPDEVLPRIEFFKLRYGLWLDSGDGPAALFDYLLNYDTGDFDWEDRPPMTEAKREMIESGKSDLDLWVTQLREAPERVLRVGATQLRADLFTAAQLLGLYQLEDPNGRQRVQANGMARALSKGGFKKANGGNNVLGEKYYVIRHHDKWATASHDALAAHLKQYAVSQ